MLVTLAAVSIAGACAIGVAGAIAFEPWLVDRSSRSVSSSYSPTTSSSSAASFHSDLWFGLAWGGFPVACGYAAVAGDLDLVALLAAAFAVLLSLAQRALSNHVRFVRRRVSSSTGRSSSRTALASELDTDSLIAAEERGLRLLAAASVVLAAALVAFRL